jgi:hypothetical protein
LINVRALFKEMTSAPLQEMFPKSDKEEEERVREVLRNTWDALRFSIELYSKRGRVVGKVA